MGRDDINFSDEAASLMREGIRRLHMKSRGSICVGAPFGTVSRDLAILSVRLVLARCDVLAHIFWIKVCDCRRCLSYSVSCRRNLSCVRLSHFCHLLVHIPAS